MTAAFQELTTSNAQITAELNVLKTELAKNGGASANPSSILKKINNTDGINRNLNPSANVFNSRYVRFTPSGRPVNLCENCHANKSTYCRHCFKCGDGSHKIGACPN